MLKSSRTISLKLNIVKSITVSLKSVSSSTKLQIRNSHCLSLIFSQGCLEHANDICIKCSLAKECGDRMQTKECNLVAKSDMDKRVKDETNKIKGKASFSGNQYLYCSIKVLYAQFEPRILSVCKAHMIYGTKV